MSDLYTQFVTGIKEHRAPSCLEVQRMQIYQDWKDGDGETNNCVTESEAVSMAIGHNHVQYMEHLLQESPVSAMITGGFSCSHLARAVETDRPAIVRRLLQHTLMLPWSSDSHRSGLHRYGFRTLYNRQSHHGVRTKDQFKSKKTRKAFMMGYMNKPSGCLMSGPSKTAVHLASEMGRAACLAELLHHGAVPTPTDNSGLTPMDLGLHKLCSMSGDNKNITRTDVALALKELLRYLPVVRASPEILALVRETAKRADISAELSGVLEWVLGEIGTPRSLQQICRHRIRSEIGRAHMQPVPIGVFELPLPKLITNYLFA